MIHRNKYIYGRTSVYNINYPIVDDKVGQGDHVPCFISAPPKISVTQIVKYLKGISGNTLRKEFPELRNFLWNMGKVNYGMVLIFAKQSVLHQKKTFLNR